MSDKLARYLPRLSFLETTEPGSLNLARHYLEMAAALDRTDRITALQLYDHADQIFAKNFATAPDAVRAGMSLSLNNRAALELDAHNWADAVDAAAQAVGLRRDRLGTMVAGRSDQLRLDLGYSLAALAMAYRGLGNLAGARDTSIEALAVLGILAGQQNEQAFVLLTGLIRLYVDMCQQTASHPDVDILMTIAKAFYTPRQPTG